MKEAIGTYYQEHPDRLLDERSQKAIKVSLDGLKALYAIIDDYDLTFRAEPYTADERREPMK